jgi:UDP-N-acetylglucosamine acyltransferase
MSTTNIHPTAIVDPGAQLGEGVTVGPYSIIEPDVTIGDGTKIASHALIASGARIGKNVNVHHGAVISTLPQDLKFEGEVTTAEIGDNTVLREYCTVNRGTKDKWKTTVGSNVLVMAYAHVAHDCIIGDRVILANSVNLAGHVTIQDWAIVGGIVPIHQFVTIGRHAIIGGGFRVQQDVCPYSLVGGYPLRVIDVNHVGLTRRGFSDDAVKTLRKAFKILFRSKLNTSQAFEQIANEMEMIPELIEIKDFFESSERGVIK